MATTTRRPIPRGADAPDPHDPPALPGVVDAATQTLWGALSAGRAARIFHPDGDAFEAVLRVRAPARGEGRGVALLDVPAEHRAIVRLSRATGIPRPLPDALGVAIRVPDAHGRGRHQDLLFVTSLDGAVLHHLILPAPFGWRQSLSTILPYRVGGALRLFGVRRRAEDAFDLSVARPLGRWRPFADVLLGDRLPGRVSKRLRFNVWHTGGGIEPVGLLQRLRDPAYRGSQRGRGA